MLNVHVPVSTVLDLSREPGRLDRYGAVSAEHVRLMRPTSLRRVMVDAHTGRPLAVDDRTTPASSDPQAARQQILDMLRPAVVADVDEPQHDPSTRLARLIDLRDLHCIGPGCSSSRCDRDHLDPAARPAPATSSIVKPPRSQASSVVLPKSDSPPAAGETCRYQLLRRRPYELVRHWWHAGHVCSQAAELWPRI